MDSDDVTNLVVWGLPPGVTLQELAPAALIMLAVVGGAAFAAWLWRNSGPPASVEYLAARSESLPTVSRWGPPSQIHDSQSMKGVFQ